MAIELTRVNSQVPGQKSKKGANSQFLFECTFNLSQEHEQRLFQKKKTILKNVQIFCILSFLCWPQSCGQEMA